MALTVVRFSPLAAGLALVAGFALLGGVVEKVLEPAGRRVVARAQDQGGEGVLPEHGGHQRLLGPKLGVERRAGRVHDPHDDPLAGPGRAVPAGCGLLGFRVLAEQETLPTSRRSRLRAEASLSGGRSRPSSRAIPSPRTTSIIGRAEADLSSASGPRRLPDGENHVPPGRSCKWWTAAARSGFSTPRSWRKRRFGRPGGASNNG